MFRSLSRFSMLSSAVVLAAVLATSVTDVPTARALVPTPAYEQATYNDALWSDISVTGASWPDTFPASWTAGYMDEAAIAGGALPSLSALGTVALGATAFDVGWKIGRVIDTKFLHLTDPNCVIFGCPDNSGNTSIKYASIQMGNPRFLDCVDSTCSLYNGGAYQVPGYSGTYDLYFASTTAGSTIVHEGSTNWDGGRFPIYPGHGTWPQWMQEFEVGGPVWNNAIAAGWIPYVESTSASNCGYSSVNPPSAGCEGLYKEDRSTVSQLVTSAPVPYTNQTWNHATSISAPTETSAHITAIQNEIGSWSPAAQNEVNAALDPNDYERPGPNGSPPGGYKITWAPANTDETYDQYVTRLQGLGWLGGATKVTLDDDNGDSEYLASGVPCTSVVSGSTIGANDPATIYQNPATLGTGDPTQGVPACTGRLATSLTSNKCTFHTIAWATQIQGNEDFYNGACTDSWNYFWANQDIFNTDGTITQYALDNNLVKQIVSGDKLQKDADLWAILSAQDSNPDHWAKGTTTSFADATYPFQIHFTWYLPTNTVRFDVDFKIRFNSVFSP